MTCHPSINNPLVSKIVNIWGIFRMNGRGSNNFERWCFFNHHQRFRWYIFFSSRKKHNFEFITSIIFLYIYFTLNLWRLLEGIGGTTWKNEETPPPLENWGDVPPLKNWGNVHPCWWKSEGMSPLWKIIKTSSQLSFFSL